MAQMGDVIHGLDIQQAMFSAQSRSL